MGSYMKVELMRGPGMNEEDVVNTDDYHFDTYPSNGQIFQNYGLFSWLAGRRQGLKPRTDWKQYEELTGKFFVKFNHRKFLEDNQGVVGFGFYREFSLRETIGFDDCYAIIYPVGVLLEFDYDQVQILDNGEPDEEGRTYRDQFKGDLLPILEYAKLHRWTHIMFAID